MMKKTLIFVMLMLIALTGVGCTHFDEAESNMGSEMEDNMENMREIEFREIDLSEPYWAGESWDEVGAETRGDIDLSRFGDQEVTSREMAEKIANSILAQQQAEGLFSDFVLANIEYDPVENIWIFTYFPEPLEPGMTFHAAVDGDTGQLLRTWVY